MRKSYEIKISTNHLHKNYPIYTFEENNSGYVAVRIFQKKKIQFNAPSTSE